MNLESKTEDGALLVASFTLGQAAFGIDAQQVQEVTKVGDITRVHQAPAHVVGIRNLRGRIVTVLDLRRRLELGCVEPGPESRILIVEGQGEPIGLLVDRVTDTMTVNPADLQPAPPNVHGVQSRNLRGLCRGGGRLVALLDLTAILHADTESGAPALRETLLT